MELKGKWQRTLYQKNNFSIALFKASAPFKFPHNDKEQLYFKAKGFDLPLKRNIVCNFSGNWDLSSSDTKKEYIFNVTEYSDIMPTDAAGIMRYLQTLDGIGNKSATALYKAYGNNVFDVFNNNINQILEDQIIRKASFAKLKACWLKKNKKEGELFMYLAKFGVSEKVIMRIYDKYQEFALNLIKKEPYSFTGIYGFGFNTADAIAKDNNDSSDLWKYNTARIKAAIIEVLKTYENGGSFLNSYNKAFGTNHQAGNTCMNWADLYKLTQHLLDTEISDVKLYKILLSMKEERIMIENNNYVFRYETWQRESGIAKNVARLCKFNNHLSKKLTTEDSDYLLNMALAENIINFKLSSEQMNAITTVMNNGFSIITGGPGTGKTAIQKMIIYIEKQFNPDANILLAAPTGRAARKMHESTGYPARTIHSLLGLIGNDFYGSNLTSIDCDLLIVDESSMIDIELANYLFAAIGNDTRIVLVGDDKQLPSVGPGSVLRELIHSNRIPVVTLTHVFRQNTGSYAIGYNAQRIISGKERMLENDTFKFVNAENTMDIVDTVKKLYPEYVAKYGPSDVCVLSPLRRFSSHKKHTYSAVENLNMELQKLIFNYENPIKGTFLVNDRVMYTKNDDKLTNGDIGIVTAVNNYDGERVITCDFNGMSVELDGESLDNLELAYAMTIHKSQGSEYKCVFLIVDEKHSIMLKRNIIYTAITRAKQEVVIIGQKDAYIKAISREETTSRLSCLSEFVNRRFHSSVDDSENELQLQLDITS